MNVSLTPELEDFVNDRVESGLYHSASEVIRDGLRLLRERSLLLEIRREELRRELRAGLADLENGASTEWTDETLPELASKIKSEGRERKAKLS
ncbi:MAG: type II toxin-antitoxin system ParD family antitoxin [Armatimonadaceae bacterium]